jgi:uncharacterized protein YaiE (UPF0345 family)
MKVTFKNIVAGIGVLVTSMSFAQNNFCTGTVAECVLPKKDGFVFNGQSQSGAFIQGDTAKVTIVVYKDMEYRITACCPMFQQLSGKLKFRIIEEVSEAKWVTSMVTEKVDITNADGEVTGQKEVTKEVKKRVFEKVSIVRYDGYKEEKGNEFVMISDKTRKLTIEVYVPVLGGEGSGLQADDLACIGLLIEHRPAPKNISQFGR